MPNEDLGILDGSSDKETEEVKDETQQEPEEAPEEDEAEPEEDTEEDTGEESESEEPEEELEEEEEPEPEPDEKVLTTWTDIKGKYPNFAKDFPDVKNALFREQQFSEVFSSPNEAKEAQEKIQVFDQLSNDVVDQGNIENLFDTIKTQNKESFEKIAYSLLPYFQESNKDLYYEIAARPIKQLLRAAWQEGNGEQTDLGKAAAHIHKYFFKNLNFSEKVKSEGGKEPSTKSKREQELESRLQQIESSKQQEFLSAVDDSYINRMSRHIREGIDKDERLTEWSKAKVAEDVLREIQSQLKKDTRYVSAINSLIRQAGQNGFTNDFKTRIINTALVRAKSLMPEIRKRVVGDALKARGVSKNGSREPRREVRERPRISKPSSSKKPLTDLDILRG